MITERVDAVIQIRDDFGDLRQVAEERHTSPQIKNARITVWESPNGQTVVMFSSGSGLTNSHAREVVSSATLPDGGHLIVNAPAYEDGFDQALQDATGADTTITVLNDAETVRVNAAKHDEEG